jgi:hypothetical protein
MTRGRTTDAAVRDGIPVACPGVGRTFVSSGFTVPAGGPFLSLRCVFAAPDAQANAR